MTPILTRELLGVLRTPRALAVQVILAFAFALIVLLRWPTDARVDLSGAASIQVFQLFGYGLLTAVLLLVPVFPATSIVRERKQGTLSLLMNTPLSAFSIYTGKLLGVLGFVGLLLMLSLPAAAACHAMGGITLVGHILPLYGILALAAIQYSVVGLLVSTRAATTDSALRVTYGCVLALAVFAMGPHMFTQGQEGSHADYAEWLRCCSPIPGIMQLLGQGDIGGQGLINASDLAQRYAMIAAVSSLAMAIWTISQLNHTLFDRARAQGEITDDQGTGKKLFRRLMYLVDPQRRSGGIPWYVNPVMVKEFRCRPFGRSHWMLRLISVCAMLSLGLTYATTTSTVDWGVETIGGILVILQVALIVLLTPSLASGLISSERESGGWDLLRTTPLSTGRILRGKLLSVVWTLMLILLATLPGYVVMVWIKPAMEPQVRRVLICLLSTAGFALLLSAAVGSLFRRTAAATTAAYCALISIFAGTLLFWLGRDAPFGRSTVEAALTLNPLAAALAVVKAPGFESYDLIPGNWWAMGIMSAVSAFILIGQTWRLTRPS